MSPTHVPLTGAEPPTSTVASLVAPIPAHQSVSVTLVLRTPPSDPGDETVEGPFSLADLAIREASWKSDVAKVVGALKKFHLKKVHESESSHSVVFEGTAAHVEKAFTPSLAFYKTSSQTKFIGRGAGISVPASTAGIVVDILGMDHRHALVPHHSGKYTKIDRSGIAPPASLSSLTVTPVPAEWPIEVLVLVTRPGGLGDPNDLAIKGISRAQFEALYACSTTDLHSVRSALEAEHLTFVSSSRLLRTVRMRGRAQDVMNAFRASLSVYHDAALGGHFLAREGPLCAPKPISHLVAGVFGLDRRRIGSRQIPPGNGALAIPPLTRQQIEELYDFPAVTGVGQTIHIAEFGPFPNRQAFQNDFDSYWIGPGKSVQGGTVPPPPITFTRFNSGPAPPGYLPPAYATTDREASADTQVGGGAAAGAGVSLFFGDAEELGWIDVITSPLKVSPLPAASSFSWAIPEEDPGVSGMWIDAMNWFLFSLAKLGVTVCAASGDGGAGAGVADGERHVMFPASSPYALAVGGTQLAATGEEVAWNDTAVLQGASGGGVSAVNPRPPWQKLANLPQGEGRLVPDVASLAGTPALAGCYAPDPIAVASGTSVAAPLWAGLITRLNATLPPAKRNQFLPLLLYSVDGANEPLGITVCKDISTGNNTFPAGAHQGFEATQGYDLVTGWGSPKGKALQAQLTSWKQWPVPYLRHHKLGAPVAALLLGDCCIRLSGWLVPVHDGNDYRLYLDRTGCRWLTLPRTSVVRFSQNPNDCPPTILCIEPASPVQIVNNGVCVTTRASNLSTLR